MPQLSIVIAAHNEGSLLSSTIAACRETCTDVDHEIIVIDDASTDDSVAQMQAQCGDVAVHRLPERHGCSPAKDLGATLARGEVLLFLDAHCKPEPGAISQLVLDVVQLQDEAVITPTIVTLDVGTWSNEKTSPGHGYMVDLATVTWKWVPREQLRPRGRFLESPSLIGCCVAVSRSLYEKLWGFDRDMYMWGAEDVDFGLKSWLMGYSVLNDPQAVIGHRFQPSFTAYAVPPSHVVANQMRLAYKALSPDLWTVWLDAFRARHSATDWHHAWDVFVRRRGSAEVERVYLSQHFQHDAVWYAHRFGLTWPLDHAVGPLTA